MKTYLDNAATTRALPEVADIMRKVLTEDFGNPSSRHILGMNAEKYITDAKKIIARSLKCRERELIFTSGGTESNNQALITSAYARRRYGKHIITSQTEHASVLEPLGFLEKNGFEVTYLPTDSLGRVRADDLENAIRDDTVLVSIMFVNNEIGAVNDIKSLSQVINTENRKRRPEDRIIFHVDAIQAYGKFEIHPHSLGIDLMSASGHKIHGPKGSGFLFAAEGTRVLPYIYGGGQENAMRSGTQNVPAIAGFGVAADAIYGDNSAERIRELTDHMYTIKRQLCEELAGLDGVTLNGISGMDEESLRETAPHIVSASIEGVRAEVLLNALSDSGVYVSSGSACSSNRPEISGTLKAVGVSDDLLDSTIRFSFSRFTTSDEISYAVEKLREIVPVLRQFRRG